jgi:signal transduction protein with GAF and PtsI domain
MTTVDGGDPRTAATAGVVPAGGGTGAVSPGGPGGPGPEVDGDPVVRAVLDAAVDSTGASAGWVLAVAGSRLHAVAVAGIGGDALVGAHVALGAGTAGYVASSGNPLALSGASGDARLADGFVALTGLKPASVLCVPCLGGTDVAGVIELVADTDGAFGFDDVEVATVLARVAAAALASGRRSAPPQPAALATRLEHLARADPARYAGVAAAVDALLPRG